MQDRYAGDIGDYVKFALLRALSPGRQLGVAWYLYPDEDHNADGRHVSYLDQPAKWRHLDPELFDALALTIRAQRTVASLEAARVLPGAVYSNEVITTGAAPATHRSDLRAAWFSRTMASLEGCELVFADPDNGLIGDEQMRRRDRKFGKQMPLSEALALAANRQAVIYHHNTRFPGGHDLEVSWWSEQLGSRTIAVRANAFSCRTFFILNPDEETVSRASAFCDQWAAHRVRLSS